MHLRMRGQFCLPENVVDLGCLTQPQQEVGGAVIATFAPATNKESDFIIIIIEILSSKYLQNILWYILVRASMGNLTVMVWDHSFVVSFHDFLANLFKR